MKYSEGGDYMAVREPRAIYVPIFDSFFESSIMREEVVTRFVFLALVRLAWRPRSQGMVDVDPFMFARSINVPEADVERAIKRLMEPDPLSGSKAKEGRRIVPIDPARPMRGWQIVNWLEYKNLLHKANDKVRKANERATSDDSGQSGQDGNVTHETRRNNTNTKRNKTNTGEGGHFVPPTLTEAKSFFESENLSGKAEAFHAYHEQAGWMLSKGRPMRSWKGAARYWSENQSRFTSQDAPQGTNDAKPLPTPRPEPTAANLAYWEAQKQVAVELAEAERLRAERGRK
jgi:hypothetical protein